MKYCISSSKFENKYWLSARRLRVQRLFKNNNNNNEPLPSAHTERLWAKPRKMENTALPSTGFFLKIPLCFQHRGQQSRAGQPGRGRITDFDEITADLSPSFECGVKEIAGSESMVTFLCRPASALRKSAFRDEDPQLFGVISSPTTATRLLWSWNSSSSPYSFPLTASSPITHSCPRHSGHSPTGRPTVDLTTEPGIDFFREGAPQTARDVRSPRRWAWPRHKAAASNAKWCHHVLEVLERSRAKTVVK